MNTIAAAELATEADSDQRVVMGGIGWQGYSTLLKVRGERPVPRMIYLDGSLCLVSPSYAHESLKERLGWFVMVLVEELDVPCLPVGSTTFRRKAKRGGVEADLTYYLANEARIRGKQKIDLRVDPPPDLAIEVVVTHEADEAVEVYRRLGVPEVWICDRDQLRILVLQPDGGYADAGRSAAVPCLSAAEIHAWVVRPRVESDTAWVKELRRWVAEVLLPRHRESRNR